MWKSDNPMIFPQVQSGHALLILLAHHGENKALPDPTNKQNNALSGTEIVLCILKYFFEFLFMLSAKKCLPSASV